MAVTGVRWKEGAYRTKQPWQYVVKLESLLTILHPQDDDILCKDTTNTPPQCTSAILNLHSCTSSLKQERCFILVTKRRNHNFLRPGAVGCLISLSDRTQKTGGDSGL